MPQRPFSRSQAFLVPPSLDDWLPAEHPARFVADLLDGLDEAAWRELGIDRTPAAKGEKRYAPEALLAIWVYGFMSGIRSTRGLEAACRDQISFRWLSGNQTPDHNTLARFYRQHQEALRGLFRQTVRVAVQSGLVDWVLQAVDGTKIVANASGRQTLTEAELTALLGRVEAAIAELEDPQATNDDAGPPPLPPALRGLQQRRARIAAALAAVQQSGRPAQANTTDPDAHLMQTGPKRTIQPAYNAQAVVCAVPGPDEGPRGRLIVGALVRTNADDHAGLVPLLEQASTLTGQPAEVTTTDGGYYSGANLAACAQRGAAVVIPERRTTTTNPYHHQHFAYDAAGDTYTCPEGNPLRFAGLSRDRQGEPVRRYRTEPQHCRQCGAFGACTTNHRHGRILHISAHEPVQQAHRAWMASEPAQQAQRRRGPLIEAVFGTIKEQLRGRRFLHRGRAAVETEWLLLSAAFNLRTLWRWGRGGQRSVGLPQTVTP